MNCLIKFPIHFVCKFLQGNFSFKLISLANFIFATVIYWNDRNIKIHFLILSATTYKVHWRTPTFDMQGHLKITSRENWVYEMIDIY